MGLLDEPLIADLVAEDRKKLAIYKEAKRKRRGVDMYNLYKSGWYSPSSEPLCDEMYKVQEGGETILE